MLTQKVQNIACWLTNFGENMYFLLCCIIFLCWGLLLFTGCKNVTLQSAATAKNPIPQRLKLPEEFCVITETAAGLLLSSSFIMDSVIISSIIDSHSTTGFMVYHIRLKRTYSLPHNLI